MSTGRSPPASLDNSLGQPQHKKQKMDTEETDNNLPQDSVLLNGIDSALIARLPRHALLDIIVQVLPNSTAMKAIVLDKLSNENLLTDEEIEEGWFEDEEDADATDIEELSGEEADSSQQNEVEDVGPLAGLSVLAKLIMEIMNSAPAPEGGMPWREFEGIWPDVMGTVEDAIKECMGQGMLVAVNGNSEFVVSTMPLVETVLEE